MKSKPLKTVLALIVLVFVASVLVTPKALSLPYYEGVNGTQVIAHQGGDGVWPGDRPP